MRRPAWPTHSKNGPTPNSGQRDLITSGLEVDLRAGLMLRPALFCALAGLVALAGCAYTTVPPKLAPPAPGPVVHTGQAAMLAPVKDRRSWPAMESKRPIPNVRLYKKEITATLRRALQKRGLFTALPGPQDPEGLALEHQLQVSVQRFQLKSIGTNAWVVPHLLADGLALPVFTVVALATSAEVDMGAYVFPSTKAATTLKVKVVLRQRDLPLPILVRNYLVTLPLGSMSQRQFMDQMGDAQSYGASLGREEGIKALDRLAETMSRDPYWAYLDRYRRVRLVQYMYNRYRAALKRARKKEANRQKAARKKGALPKATPAPATAAAPPAPGNRPQPWNLQQKWRPPCLAEVVQGAQDLLDILPQPAYLPEVANIIRDPYLKFKKTPLKRAALIDDIRAQRLGLADASKLPPHLRMPPEKMDALYDDPEVANSLVETDLARRILRIVVGVLTPPPPLEGEAAVPEGAFTRRGVMFQGQLWLPSARGPVGSLTPLVYPEPKNAGQMRARLRRNLAARLKASPRLQVLLLPLADRATRWAWPAMQELLLQVDSPVTRAYLGRRGYLVQAQAKSPAR